MARGWESKEVESQIESAAEAREERAKASQLTLEQAALERETEGLRLSRERVVRDLAEAQNPRYREQLQRTLEYLDGKIAALAARE